MDKTFYVYMVTNKRNGTLYIVVTNNLARRIFEHKNKISAGFTKKYKLDQLVYFEVTNDINAALIREKQLKHWNRSWKISLIESENPDWVDMAGTLL